MIMKIAQIYPFPPPIQENVAYLPGGVVTGGGETYPLSLSRKLAERGHYVTFLTGKLKGITQDYLRINDNLRIYYLPIFFGNSSQWAFSFQLIRMLLKENYDVIHSHQLPTVFSFIGGIVSKIKHKPLIVSHLGFVPRLSRSSLLISKINSLLVSKMTVPNEYSARFYDRVVSRKKVEILPLGIRSDFFAYQEPTEQMVRAYKRTGDEKIIYYVGRLLPSKGLDLLLKATQILLNKGLLVRLLITGKGSFEDYLRKMVRDLKMEAKVVFTGFIKDQDLPQYYSLADVFVLPSVYLNCLGGYNPEPEAFGLVLAEAMSCGTPVLASNVGGIPFWIRHRYNGLLFEPGNEVDLAQQIEALLTDEALRQEIRKNALKELERKYSLDVICEKLEKIYGESQ